MKTVLHSAIIGMKFHQAFCSPVILTLMLLSTCTYFNPQGTYVHCLLLPLLLYNGPSHTVRDSI